MADDKTLCQTPTPGKQPTAIPTWKYEAVRKAILAVVPRKQPGIPFKDLPSLVAERLAPDVRGKLGSVTWHTTTVKLDLEVRGELARVPGARTQHLVRT